MGSVGSVGWWKIPIRRDGEKKHMEKQRSIDVEGDHFFIEHHHR